jgi:CheY-like chemotaxis protein
VSIVQQLIEDYRECNRVEAAASCVRKLPHCLIVEDERSDIELTEYALNKLGVSWDVARTGEDAIKLLDRSKDPLKPDFDIVFLDLVLRGSAAQGIQVLEHVRKHFPSVHVVLVSGYVDSAILNLVAKHKGQGAYLGIVTKPLNIADATEIFKKHNLPTSASFEI